MNRPTRNRNPRGFLKHSVLKLRQNPPSSLPQPRQNLRCLNPNSLRGLGIKHNINIRHQLRQRIVQIKNLEQLLRRPPANTNGLGEVEELNRRALHSLHEASVIDRGSNSIEDLLAELLFTGKERPDADFRGSYPAPDFVLELVPLEALHVADAELLDTELAEAGVDGGFPDAAVHLDALAQVAG
ncbi:hypothetical protein V8G54_002216 [Vigna mungo]|uniref:Uncharacterized protein n=1 Tax=Vigna mungo TaxID=3915 RepID=A0AAQ3SAM4_VIGMU